MSNIAIIALNTLRTQLKMHIKIGDRVKIRHSKVDQHDDPELMFEPMDLEYEVQSVNEYTGVITIKLSQGYIYSAPSRQFDKIVTKGRIYVPQLKQWHNLLNRLKKEQD